MIEDVDLFRQRRFIPSSSHTMEKSHSPDNWTPIQGQRPPCVPKLPYSKHTHFIKFIMWRNYPSVPAKRGFGSAIRAVVVLPPKLIRSRDSREREGGPLSVGVDGESPAMWVESLRMDRAPLIGSYEDERHCQTFREKRSEGTSERYWFVGVELFWRWAQMASRTTSETETYRPCEASTYCLSCL